MTVGVNPGAPALFLVTFILGTGNIPWSRARVVHLESLVRGPMRRSNSLDQIRGQACLCAVRKLEIAWARRARRAMILYMCRNVRTIWDSVGINMG